MATLKTLSIQPIKTKDLELQTVIKIKIENGRRDFILKSIFLDNTGTKIKNIDDIPRKDLEEIVKQFRKEVMSKEDIKINEDNINNSSNLLSGVISRLEIAFGTLNVITENSEEEHIVRTTVELDADVITILKKELAESINGDLMLSIHGINVVIINKFFRSQILRISKQIRSKIKRWRIGSVHCRRSFYYIWNASLMRYVMPLARKMVLMIQIPK